MPDSVKHKIPVTPQDDYHTCGFCAANSVYKFYGLDPEERDLREYLGTDHLLPCNVPFRDRIEKLLGGADNMLSGTSPMDMLAVLYWDGFDCRIPSDYEFPYSANLEQHLQGGDCAIAMLYDCFHWVVVSGIDLEGVWVVDGFFTAKDIVEGSRSKSHTFRIPQEQFATLVHGIIYLSREDCAADEMREMTNTDFVREYARGVGFCCKILRRQIPRYISRLLPVE
jgi:hypothetical protein